MRGCWCNFSKKNLQEKDNVIKTNAYSIRKKEEVLFNSNKNYEKMVT